MKVINRFVLFTTLLFFMSSCGSKVDRQYNNLMEYVNTIDYEVTYAGHESGNVTGTSKWKWLENNKAIQVKYSALGYTETEIGDIKKLTLDKSSCGFADCSTYFNVSFSGIWDCRTSGDGRLNIAFSSVEPEIVVIIFGEGNWKHSRYMKLKTTFDEYRKKLLELGILTEEDVKKLKNATATPSEEPIADSNASYENSESIDTALAPISANDQVDKQYYEINDPDGYTNLRDAPNGKILKKVMQGEKFEIIKKGDAYSKIILVNGGEGYIHNSRITPAQ